MSVLFLIHRLRIVKTSENVRGGEGQGRSLVLWCSTVEHRETGYRSTKERVFLIGLLLVYHPERNPDPYECQNVRLSRKLIIVNCDSKWGCRIPTPVPRMTLEVRDLCRVTRGFIFDGSKLVYDIRFVTCMY